MRMMLLKKLALAGLYFSLSWTRHSRGLTVLTYHRVPSTPDLDDSLKVSANVLDLQMKFLRENYLILKPSEIAEIIRNKGEFPPKSCLVTFDDGWKDNYENAYPILKKHDIPALIFLSTGLIGTSRVFWHEQISDLTKRIPSLGNHDFLDKISSRLPEPVIKRILEITQADGSRKGLLIHHFIIFLKQFDVDFNEALADALRTAFDIKLSTNDHAMLSWDNVSEMANNGIYFGSHTVSHELLDRLPDERVVFELIESKKCIEERLKVPVEFLSYPNGNYTPRTTELAREAGYIGAFTCIGGSNADSLFVHELKRLHIRESSSLGPTGRFSDLFFSIDLSGLRNSLNSIRPNSHY